MLWSAVVLLMLLLGLSAWLNVRTLQQNLQLSDQREALVDQIEQSLDLLDGIYGRFAQHAELPVMSDEPVIQGIVHDIKLARNTVLAVASLVAAYGDAEDQDNG